jgi:hypothetical protein
MCCRLSINRTEIEKHVAEYTGGLNDEDYKDTHQKGGGFFGAAPNTGCYDEETEVLTGSGWKLWKNVTLEDTFATMNMDSKNLEYQKPTQLFNYDYSGDMIEFKNKNFNLLVTPNHNMLIESKDTKKCKLISAESIVGKWETYIPKKSIWVGKDIEFFELDSITFNEYSKTNEKIQIKTTPKLFI